MTTMIQKWLVAYRFNGKYKVCIDLFDTQEDAEAARAMYPHTVKPIMIEFEEPV